LLIIPLIYFKFLQQLKAPFLGANYLSDGILLLKDSERIRYSNRSAFLLAEKSGDPACKNLKLCFPPLHDALQSFISSKLKIHETYVTLFPESNSIRYKAILFRVHLHKVRYMITFQACLGEDKSYQETIQWADIARRLSHHVRRHITNIMLSLEALQHDKDTARQDYYQIIGSEIEKVRVFTHAFQRFTEMKEYDLQQHDIIPSLEHCLARITMPPNVKLLKNWGLQSISAYIEPIRFEEAVVNTINNALEAMPKGGSLHITAKEMPQSSALNATHKVLVEIEDSGEGIPAKYMDDIYRPFFTTKQNGTGIGIPETKKIIESMGGVLCIQSEEGVGTTVTIWLKGEK
jgi:nitrogen fixation/metabolism regulation signal transduction histidine kinase